MVNGWARLEPLSYPLAVQLPSRRSATAVAAWSERRRRRVPGHDGIGGPGRIGGVNGFAVGPLLAGDQGEGGGSGDQIAHCAFRVGVLQDTVLFVSWADSCPPVRPSARPPVRPPPTPSARPPVRPSACLLQSSGDAAHRTTRIIPTDNPNPPAYH